MTNVEEPGNFKCQAPKPARGPGAQMIVDRRKIPLAKAAGLPQSFGRSSHSQKINEPSSAPRRNRRKSFCNDGKPDAHAREYP